MKNLKVLQIVLNSLIVLLFLAIGVTIIVLGTTNDQYDNIMLGIFLLLAGFARLAIYFMTRGYAEPVNFNLLSGVAFLVFGIVFLSAPHDLEIMCFGWGIMEIIVGGAEIQSSLFTFKQDKLSILEIIISSGGIIFGVLLCVRMSEALLEHLIFMGISLILMAVLTGLRLFFDLRNNK